MADTPKLEVGQDLVIYENGKHRLTAPIVKIGPKLVHIERYGGRTEAYRRDTQKLNGGQYSGDYFRTLEQAAEDERRTLAVVALREAGLELRLSKANQFNADQIEQIAALVRSFTEEENTHG